MQFGDHRGELLARGIVIEVIDDGCWAVIGHGLGEGAAGGHQGAVAGVEGVDIAVVGVVRQGSGGRLNPQSCEADPEGNQNTEEAATRQAQWHDFCAQCGAIVAFSRG